MEPCITTFRDPGGVWEVTPANKASILGAHLNHREYGVIRELIGGYNRDNVSF